MTDWNIYVMSNPAMPGLVKIGGSICAEARAEQLSLNTAIPHPFRVEYSQPVHEGRETEALAHLALDEERVNPAREFFRVDVGTAVVSVQTAALQAAWNNGSSKARRRFRVWLEETEEPVFDRG